MRKKVIVYIKPVIIVTCAALCAAAALIAGGCSRTVTRVEKAGMPAADTAVGDRKMNTDPSVRVSAEGAEAAEPAITRGGDGEVYVAWVEHKAGGKADVWLARYDGEGRASSPPSRINPNEGEAAAWRGDPPTVAAAPDGTVYVGWTARDEGAPHATTLYVSASRDGGRVVDVLPGEAGRPRHALAGRLRRWSCLCCMAR